MLTLKDLSVCSKVCLKMEETSLTYTDYVLAALLLFFLLILTWSTQMISVNLLVIF